MPPEEAVVARRLLAVTEASLQRRAQLEGALASRIVIEQAKGVLAERFGIGVDDAFQILRRSARAERMKIHELAAEVVSSPHTPAGITRALARARERAV